MKLKHGLFLGFAVLFGTTMFSLIGCGDDAPETPGLTGTVSITGNPKVGETLTADTTKLGGNGTITYQWKRLDSATGTTIGKRQHLCLWGHGFRPEGAAHAQYNVDTCC